MVLQAARYSDHMGTVEFNNHTADLQRGVNAAPLATLLAKLAQVGQGQPIVLTKAEFVVLTLSAELIYRKGRVEGNIERQGLDSVSRPPICYLNPGSSAHSSGSWPVFPRSG